MPDISQLHFIRPWAWLLLIPVAILFWLYKSKGQQQAGWAQLIDEHLLSWLMPKSNQHNRNKWRTIYLLLFWLVAVVALSGPTWKQLPQPVFSSKASRVIVLDLSMSMDAQDIEPSRLARAKFKIRDLLELTKDGQTGLVVYAGDGFILSPLTTDTDTIDNLIGALATNIMPIMGSKADTGIKKAIELLSNANQVQGDIIWITDGADNRELENITTHLENTNYSLKILAIGTAEGAPIKMQGGAGFVKDNRGNIVIPKLDYSKLATFANSTDASLTSLTVDNTDVEILAQQRINSMQDQVEKQDLFADAWEDSGYWFVLLLLPLVLLSFKHRNLLGCIFVVVLGTSLPLNQAKANPIEKLFLNKNQQGQQLLKQEKFDDAYQTFEDPQWKAVAAYRNGDYQTAKEAFNQTEQPNSAINYFNQGNALALAQQYQQAIDAYNQALSLDPKHEDAAFNKKVIEDLQKQQQEQEQQNQEQQEQNQQNQQQQQDQQQEQSDSETDDNEQQQQQEQQSEQEQQQQELTEQELQDQFEEQEKDQELEQWLRRIPDDPGGLLRRKMYQEYRKRGANQQVDKTW
ncbi:MAG: VWA domain-containing protein [Kangiellaceae bacterium]|nr:VWA domain-containing protein [Kangiellaceae bacterium]